VCEEKSQDINILPKSKISVGFAKYPNQEVSMEENKEESIQI